MELVRGLHNLRPEHHGCAATIGSFDGVHLGHQAVLDKLSEEARTRGLPVTLITFEPQPREYFSPGPTPPRLTRFREKLEALQTCPVDRVVCLRFSDALAALTANEFIQQLLIDGLGVKYLVVGDDFRFGKNRRGDKGLLQQSANVHGYQLGTLEDFEMGGQRVSSTRVREALEGGDLDTATALLGRPYSMCGRVAHGDKRGRTIGFPTANIYLHRASAPVSGVFAVEMLGIDTVPIPGVANVGTRPTVDGIRALLEVHLFDFDRDIYGRHVQVRFVKKLREERKFESFEHLKQQILLDSGQARACFPD
jgi:riboflavin kinase/FMN adenylyltransferase